MDKKLDTIKDFLEGLVRHLDTDLDATSFTYNDSDGSYWFSVTTKKPEYLIGKDGEVIQAISMLARRLLEDDGAPEARIQVIVEVNDYQKKKIENLKTIAHMMSERARYFKSNIAIDPMNAYERKIVHSFLQDKVDIKTESEGIGRGRHIVIKYIGGN